MNSFPRILEINSWTYLNRLSKQLSKPVHIGNVPESEWEKFKRQGFDSIWLMGVWKRSPKARELALRIPDLTQLYTRFAPHWKPEDICGSPYAIAAYDFEAQIGSRTDFKKLRKTFEKLGLSLILDFVPNHLAIDHEAAKKYPHYFLQGLEENMNSGLFFRSPENRIFAYGRDPYFDPWKDTIQVNFFSDDYRNFAIQTVCMISEYAHGVRCDMAMLGLSDVFEQTWRRFLPVQSKPKTEFWDVVIQEVKKKAPNFKWIAEVYWGLEKKLQELGFDFTYDKELYDKLLKGPVWEIGKHLRSDLFSHNKMVRFLENHDEPRAISTFGLEKSKAAAVVIDTVPGAKLFQEGQREGKKTKIPVQMGIDLNEPVSSNLAQFYDQLFKFTSKEIFQTGDWQILEVQEAWAGGKCAENILAWMWTKGNFSRLIIVNYSEGKSQARVRLPEIKKNPLVLADVFTSEIYHRDLGEIKTQGLYVELEGWKFHGFEIK